MAKRLTPLGLQNLKPGPQRREISDGGSGLYTVIQSSGRRGWCVRYRFQGTPRKLTLDRNLTLAAARKAAADALHEVERGVDPASNKKMMKAAAEIVAGNTLHAIAEAHLKREESKPADKRLRTINQRRATFERLIFPKLGNRPVNAIRRSDIVRLLDDVEASSGGRMADEVLSALRIVFDWHARRDDDFSSPVVRGMALTKPQDRIRNRILTDDEVARIWQAAEGMAGPFGRYVQFLLLTAARRNEAARMTYAEVKAGDWLIPAARYKTKAAHLIPLSSAARSILATMPRFAGCDFVFTSDGAHAISGFSRYKVKLDKAAGVSDYTIHDLRRTSRSLMSAAGCNPDHAERCLGHALPGIRKNYDFHEYRVEKLAAFEALAAHIFRLINPPAGKVVTLRGRGHA
jgi:integrase